MEKTNLTFMDGFQFGCGFFVAGLVYSIIMAFIFFVVIVVFGSALGGRLMF